MADVLEKGDIFFLYAPRVEEAHPDARSDVQRLHVVLRPTRGDSRLLVIGRKRMPRIPRHEKEWGFVERVEPEPRALHEDVEERSYDTRTRGERRQPGDRPAGEGVYAIVRHDDHTHLAYALELPAEPGDVQEALRIEPEGSFILSVKNPDQPSPKGVGLSPPRRAHYPDALQHQFGDRRFTPADPPAFLDHAGAEFVLIGAEADVEDELGVHLDPEAERLGTSDLIDALRLERSHHPRAPLREGEWA